MRKRRKRLKDHKVVPTESRPGVEYIVVDPGSFGVRIGVVNKIRDRVEQKIMVWSRDELVEGEASIFQQDRIASQRITIEG